MRHIYIMLGIFGMCLLLLGCVIATNNAGALSWKNVTKKANIKEITIKGSCWGFTVCKDPKRAEISLPMGSVVTYSINPLRAIVIYPNGERIMYRTSERVTIPVPGPNGKEEYISPLTVFEVPSGSFIYNFNGITYVYGPSGKLLLIQVATNLPKTYSTQNAPSPSSDKDCYLASAYDLSIKELTQYVAYWNVPALPLQPNASEVIFIFNGIEPKSNANRIIQPVLQYNWDGSGKWEICSWYVGGGFGAHTQQVPVKPGDAIRGALYLKFLPIIKPMSNNLHENPTIFVPIPKWYWTIVTTDVTTGTSLSIKTVENYINYQDLWVLLSLETYGVQTIGNLPGSSILFYNLQLNDFGNSISPHWSTGVNEQWKGVITVKVYSPQCVWIIINNRGGEGV